ncbi:MAG: ABC transporter ATP-binding protein/permease [Turicibacter sp.]|nr:ABC transporter ATP-binding protein/permease [Turicibacter sp.]
MLTLKGVAKSYTVGEFTQQALKGVDLSFRKSEFVAILGPSGSGKTTCLNIIGGLDHYDAGDLFINGKSTKDFKDKDWDAYRNNSVGFVFQSYNLISHLSLIDNVEMGMTLSGVGAAKKKAKALEVLERVGLKDHVHKRPNQLSGGQMQRVAIARALANDPDIILADEPTGALDTTTSQQIMDLIKEIAEDKLVIMVTHNPELAEEYADRTVRFKDGVVVDDTNPYHPTAAASSNYALKHTSMSFFTALMLSARNIATKKWRTALTAFASSIGIIGIALILSLSNGFQVQIDQFQENALSEFPIIVSQQAMNIDAESIQARREGADERQAAREAQRDSDAIFLFDPADSMMIHNNVFSDEFMGHLDGFDPAIVRSIGFTRIVNMNLLRDVGGQVQPVSFSSQSSTDGPMMGGMPAGTGLSSFPVSLDENEETSWLESNYDLLAGAYPSDETDLLLVVDEWNRIDLNVLRNLGFDVEVEGSLDFEEIVGTEILLVPNDNFYFQTEMGNFLPNQDLDEAFGADGNITLRISGIVRLNPDVSIGLLNSGVAYSDALVQRLIDIENTSEIVEAQREADFNVMTLEPLDEAGRDSFVTFLGGDPTPFIIFIYPTDFESKDAILSYLNDFNTGQPEEYRIVYTDLAATMTDMTGGIMSAITMVLIAFAAISLVVSLIMIAIITYISVIERTKEIGVLRALGARKKDITRVFNAETFIIGACSGALAILITYALQLPINQAIEGATDLANVAQLNPVHAIFLVGLSLVLTLLGGMIPARMAAKKDPVEALRSE